MLIRKSKFKRSLFLLSEKVQAMRSQQSCHGRHSKQGDLDIQGVWVRGDRYHGRKDHPVHVFEVTENG